MKNFLTFKVWPVVAGLLAAFAVMMVCEYVNSLFYPLPADLDLRDATALKAFTSTLPLSAYILVLTGWALGAFKAGCITTYFSKEKKYRLSFLVGLILTILGIANNIIIGHAMVVNVLGLPLFALFTYFGHRVVAREKAGRTN